MAETPVRVELGTVVNTVVDDVVKLGVNIAGTVIPATWVGGYVPTAGDSVSVLIVSGAAYVLGHIHTGARPIVGSIIGAPSNGVVAVSTTVGNISCRYIGTPPASGSIVRIDWQSSTPWIWPSAVAAIPAPDNPSSPQGPGAPPAGPASGTLDIPAIQSSTWGSASGWNRYGDDVRQWRFGSEADCRGAWFYGAAATQLAGKTVTGARIFLPGRVRVGSYNAAMVLHLYRHTSQSIPGGDVARVKGPFDVVLPPINAGGLGWTAIPTDVAQDMTTDGGGIGVYGSPYGGVVGLSGDRQSGRIQIDWRS